MTTRSHHNNVEKQFGSQTNAYLTSAAHSSGRDLQRLGERLSVFPQARVLDMGREAGHANSVVTQHVKQIMAYDLLSWMLEMAAEMAKDRGLGNVTTCQGYAESLPFENSEFDVAISRYPAYHWHDVGRVLRGVNRVLKPGGVLIVMDMMPPGRPVRDTWLQTVGMLRDTSHVHNYPNGEWLSSISDANLIVDTLLIDCLPLELSSWVARMRMPAVLNDAIHAYQRSAPTDMKTYFALREDGSFTSDAIMVKAHRVG